MQGEKFDMVMDAIDSDPENPSPTVSVDLAKTSRVYLETLGIFSRV